MKILIMNGSPDKNIFTENLQNLLDAFKKGARGAGHDVAECVVGTMDINGCNGCQYCQEKGENRCSIKDDMEKVYPEAASADIIIFASPIHYSFFTPQMVSAIGRLYALEPMKEKKFALFLCAFAPEVCVGMEGAYKSLIDYLGAENLGIKKIILDGSDFGTVLADAESFGASIQ